ncbi:MAG: hypothetical protein FWG73_03980 [Planctomycetaceae bacterium]|nr:hypothetical protein [Planctomycetaceae bacterium]
MQQQPQHWHASPQVQTPSVQHASQHWHASASQQQPAVLLQPLHRQSVHSQASVEQSPQHPQLFPQAALHGASQGAGQAAGAHLLLVPQPALGRSAFGLATLSAQQDFALPISQVLPLLALRAKTAVSETRANTAANPRMIL